MKNTKLETIKNDNENIQISIKKENIISSKSISENIISCVLIPKIFKLVIKKVVK